LQAFPYAENQRCKTPVAKFPPQNSAVGTPQPPKVRQPQKYGRFKSAAAALGRYAF